MAGVATKRLNIMPHDETLQPWEERLLDEYKELDKRLKKFEAFIMDDPEYSKLDKNQLVFMSMQFGGMKLYHEALFARIDDLGLASFLNN